MNASASRRSRSSGACGCVARGEGIFSRPAGMVAPARDLVRFRAGGDQLVDLVLADVLVGARALVGEHARIVFGDARDHLVVRARNQHLRWLREAHHALGNVDAVADDVRLAVDVAHQSHRPQVDAGARTAGRRHRTPLRSRCTRLIATNSASSGSPRKLIATPSPVSRMMRSSGGDVGDRLRDVGVEALLDLELLGDRFLRVLDDIDEQHRAHESAVGPVPGRGEREHAAGRCGRILRYTGVQGRHLLHRPVGKGLWISNLECSPGRSPRAAPRTVSSSIMGPGEPIASHKAKKTPACPPHATH